MRQWLMYLLCSLTTAGAIGYMLTANINYIIISNQGRDSRHA